MTAPGKRAWSDDERQHVKRLLRRGKSMGDIGRALGLSRNMAIGRISRDGELHAFLAKVVMSKPAPIVPPIGQAPRQVEIPAPPPDPDDEPLGPGLRMLDLKRDVCRWPVGLDEEGHHLFCGQAKLGDWSPYCRRHHAIAHPPGGAHG